MCLSLANAYRLYSRVTTTCDNKDCISSILAQMTPPARHFMILPERKARSPAFAASLLTHDDEADHRGCPPWKSRRHMSKAHALSSFYPDDAAAPQNKTKILTVQSVSIEMPPIRYIQSGATTTFDKEPVWQSSSFLFTPAQFFRNQRLGARDCRWLSRVRGDSDAQPRHLP